MALSVEIVCDVKDVRSVLAPCGQHWVTCCWSDRGLSPRGNGIKAARDEARRAGWRISRGKRATCPGCLSVENT